MGTKVINLFGGPNSGKSTAAAGLYYKLKTRGMNVELVREYVKNWAWEDRKPGTFDQPYIFGKQLRYESMLYGKVDYLVTDSPLIMSGYYERLNEGTHIVLPAAREFMSHAISNGVEYCNFWLDTVDSIDLRGRFQTPEEMREISAGMKQWLDAAMVKYTEVDSDLDSRVDLILSTIS